jgi:hypothetical protein
VVNARPAEGSHPALKKSFIGETLRNSHNFRH